MGIAEVRAPLRGSLRCDLPPEEWLTAGKDGRALSSPGQLRILDRCPYSGHRSSSRAGGYRDWHPDIHGWCHRGGVPPVGRACARDPVRHRSAEPAAAVLVIGGSGGSEPSCVGEALAHSVSRRCRSPTSPGRPAQSVAGIPLEYFFTAVEILRDAVPSPAVPLAVAGMSRAARRQC
jgi:hypothetical protein